MRRTRLSNRSLFHRSLFISRSCESVGPPLQFASRRRSPSTTTRSHRSHVMMCIISLRSLQKCPKRWTSLWNLEGRGCWSRLPTMTVLLCQWGIMDRAGPDSDLCRRLHCPDLPRRAESVPNHAPGREGGQKGALCRLGPNSRLGFVSFTLSSLDVSRRFGGLRSQPDARRVKSWGELVGELEGSDG